jgi:hypothetical protein
MVRDAGAMVRDADAMIRDADAMVRDAGREEKYKCEQRNATPGQGRRGGNIERTNRIACCQAPRSFAGCSK